ncbi:ABC transporter ATP-binding protein [Castellaniella hirudinis]|uniref:ABC transporter ATP-binding protein n=1 Tax=Castellaniella hirudinis TaxID=1144617 RepID=UPI0039C1ADB4
MSFLDLIGVSKSYGALQVVSDLHLSIEQGEFVSLLGPSGCGKTTTLHLISGLTDPTRGSIMLDGVDITHAAPNTRGLGIVFQTYALFPHMSVARNVAFGLDVRKVPRAEQQTRVAEALRLVKLEPYAERYPRELSGGQRQRVALARALVIRPPVLLLDEPLSNLDAQLREEMQYELRRIQRAVGTTTLMVTHDQSEAMSTSDRVVVMKDGRAIQVDEPYRIYEHPGSRFISGFVGKANLFEGVYRQRDGQPVVSCGEIDFELSGVPAGAFAGGDAVQVCLRPEKLHLTQAAAQLPACLVRARYFLGSQWLYEIDSALGPVTVVVTNDGRPAVEVGARVGLGWLPDAVRVLSAEA